jgi:hypothetical protein
MAFEVQKKIFGELTDLFVTYSGDAFSLTRDFVVKRCSKNVQRFKKSSRVQIKQKKSTRLCSFLAFWT